MIRTKYPRTFHIPQSPGATNDDKILLSLDHFKNKEIVVTEKRDGECTNIYSDGYLHARSIDGTNHESRNWIKGNVVPLIQNQVFKDLRFCGENLYAQHSIPYTDLTSYFEVFSIWYNEVCWPWDHTVAECNRLGLTTVPVLYEGPFSEYIINRIIMELDLETQEGFVIRTKESFLLDDFKYNVAKYVRKGHVTTDTHWMHQKIIPNKLKLK